MSGVYNAVAPYPISQRKMSKSIALQKGGFNIPFPVPAFALKLMLGKISEEVLKSTTVSATKIQDEGFRFKYPQIEDAIKAILQ
jgi:hypothetical protein